MNVFKLTVYRLTRKGEQVFVERVFTSTSSQADLSKKFNKEYAGFSVTVFPVENIEAIEADVPAPAPVQKKRLSVDTIHVYAKLIKGEDAMQASIHSLERQQKELTDKLYQSIRERYNGYIHPFGDVMEVEKTDSWNLRITIRLCNGGIESITQYVETQAEKNI